ncbi:MAG: phosphohistidine phosphatase SixA [bacterium]
MRLYLVQHAEARKEEEDPDRPLTEKGWQDARRVARYAIEWAGVRPSRVLHSGKLRAEQTTSVWEEHLAVVQVGQADGMDPIANPRIWADRLRHETEDLMLVGHLPHLRRLASLLLCGDDGQEVVAFENAGIVCLQGNPEGRWSLRWILTPAIVRP